MPNSDPAPSNARGNRPRRQRIEVWLTADEKRALADRAEKGGLSLSAYMRVAGLNQPIRSRADARAVAELVKVAADLGRLGGLLKLWLSEKRGQVVPAISVDKALGETRSLQQKMLCLAGKVLRP